LFELGLSATDTTSFPIEDFTRSVNTWLRKAVFLIWHSSSTWEFDDSNYTTLPVATADLVADQQDYSLPTEALDVQRVAVLNSSSDYVRLKKFSKEQIETSLSEYYEDSGMPAEYEVRAGSLFLYPPPATGSVTTTKGLKIYIARDINPMEITDTDKELGIQEIFQPYVSFGAALDYAIAKNMSRDKITSLKVGLQEYKDTIKVYYAKRDKDIKIKIRPGAKSSV